MKMSDSDAIVKTKQGLLRGQIEINCNGGAYYSFKGIPFAEPPVGRLRFKAPRPVKSWNGIRDALVDGSPCRSIHMHTDEKIGSEDCLYLNVFTPEYSKQNYLRPVIFFIHGGSFIKGSNNVDIYGADILLTEDIVLVSTNYRIGALGSLGFTDPTVDAPGNNGLKDCVASLQWVRENINQFGGDPNNVTIFGESAGSVSCHYLCLSHSGRGLFHRAILQSGSAIASWSCSKAQPNLLAKVVGYTGDQNDQKAIYEYLLSVPVATLQDAQNLVMVQEGYTGGLVAWAPIVEVTGCPTEPNFLTKHPLDILTSGDIYNVPIIFGYNTDEGLLMCGKSATASIKALMETTIYEYLVPLGMRSKIALGTPEAKEVGNIIHTLYWGDNVPSKDNYQPFVDYCTDVFFSISIVNAAILHAKHSSAPVYLYRFGIDLPFGWVKEKISRIPYPGCTHAEGLAYMFSNGFRKPVIDDSNEGKTIYRFVKFWSNFAKSGDPNLKNDPLLNVDWKTFTQDEESYLSFELELECKQKPNAQRRKVWDSLFKKFKIDAL